ncbi:FGGY-family carbohydrate kinase [Rhodococcus sp. 06-235-1A]|uniref:FGGY-family carbohydrate kinase n=1 Tax=Rhodococcus sp. 06-235-1A TaxID=2022508 RepID=UPI00211B54E5|nr:FGGY-family carbohydrate kinase [Rhodococcus sp. 06-235-1A]
MATIGIAIESGSMQTILFEPTSGEVLADRTTPLDPDAATVMTQAVESMRAEAATFDTDVNAVGVVYRSEAERAEFVAALGDEAVTLCSASESFLRWLAQSEELADAKTVLLYYMGDSGVSISLADAVDASLTPAKTAELDSMSPERIGSTIPLAWEVVDQSGKKPDVVALFGDSSSNRDLVDILALGLGVPVVRVGDADQIAARGAALLALEDVPDQAGEATVAPALVPAEPSFDESELDESATSEVAEPVSDESAEPKEASDLDAVVVSLPVTVVSAPATPPAVDAKPSRSGSSGRRLVFAAVLLAGVLSAGVAVAATLPGDSESTAEQSVEQRDSDADLVGATRHVDPMTTTDPVPWIAGPAPAVAPTEAIPPTVDPATDVDSAPTTEAWVTQDAPRQAVAAPQPVPAPASTTVDPPQFTVPVVVPEPGKSQEQLEQEAWDRHWQHTGAWIQQELTGG